MTNKRPPHREPQNPVGLAAELFAGVGGFRLGLARANWKTVYSNQWEPATKMQHASDVYVARFGPKGHSNEDIATVRSIPEKFDLLVGGFPCQDYSVAKSALSATGLEGKKGVLWWEILRLVQKHKPRYILLENVDRLLKSPTIQRGRDFAVMLSTLGKAGYLVEWRVVNAADYGFPQRRIRVFIMATRRSLVPKALDPSDWIFETGILTKSLPVASNGTGVLEIPISRDAAEVSDKFGHGNKISPFMNAGVFFDGTAHTARVTPTSRRKKSTLGDVLVHESKVPQEYWVPKNKLSEWERLKAAKSIDRVHQASGFVYKYSEGAMSFPDSLDRASRTILTGEGGSSPSRFKHIIRVGNRFRRLLPIELERLSGFPDDWTKTSLEREIPDSRRAFFVGNALVIGVVEMIAKTLAQELQQN